MACFLLPSLANAPSLLLHSCLHSQSSLIFASSHYSHHHCHPAETTLSSWSFTAASSTLSLLWYMIIILLRHLILGGRRRSSQDWTSLSSEGGVQVSYLDEFWYEMVMAMDMFSAYCINFKTKYNFGKQYMQNLKLNNGDILTHLFSYSPTGIYTVT